MNDVTENAAQESSKAQKKPKRRQRKTSKKSEYGRNFEEKHVGTQVFHARYKGTRTFYEFEMIIGKDTGRLKVHRVQIGRKKGQDDTEWAIKSLGENKIKNIIMDLLKKERHLRPLEVPIFSESIFSR